MKKVFTSFLLAIFIFCSSLEAQTLKKTRSRFGFSYLSFTFGIVQGHFSGFNNYVDAFNANPQVPGVTIMGRYHHAHRSTTYGLNTGFRLGIRGLFGELYWKFGSISKQVNASENAVSKPFQFYQPLNINMGFWGAGIYQRFRIYKNSYIGIGVNYGYTKYSISMETEVTEKYTTLNKATTLTYSPFLQYTFGKSPKNIRVFYSVNNTMFDYSSFNQFSNSAPNTADLKSVMNMVGIEILMPIYYSGPGKTRKIINTGDNSDNKIIYDKPIDTIQAPPQTFQNMGIKISGTTFDKKTGQPIGAELEFVNLASGYRIFAESDPATGKYEVDIDTSGHYQIVSNTKDYISYQENFKVGIYYYSREEITKDIFMDPVELGHTTAIKDILFEKATAFLLSSSYASLDQLADFLIKNPSIEIELAGYTSNEGDQKANQKLSEDRANAVKEYLMSKGVGLYRMTAIGYGSSKPLYKNDTEEYRALNRRVEYKITNK